MFQQSFKEQTPMNDPDVQDNPFLRPGFGLPLDFAPMQQNVYGIHNRSLFPNANDDRDIKEGNAEYVQAFIISGCVLQGSFLLT